jgi:hypothetical protein
VDGTETGLLTAIVVVRILGKGQEEMIILAIPNVDQDRDIMPLSTTTYEMDHPGAEKFLSFIEKGLNPDNGEKYCTDEQFEVSHYADYL